MRVEIVEECEHGNFDCDAYGRDWNDKEVTCPGGDRREATESELLTLVADLAEKVWWCEVHQFLAAPARSDRCYYQQVNESKVNDRLKDGSCRMSERLFLPVGVDGPKEER